MGRREGRAGRASRARVTLLEATVLKEQPPQAAALELARTRLGAEVGQRCGLFSVPEVLRAEPEQGRLVFARVPGLRPLRQAMAGPGALALCDRAAAALLAIHRDLDLPAGQRRQVPPALDAALPAVPLHGDYSLHNLQVQEGSDRLWILDWSAPAWLCPEATTGPPSLDLATFVLPMFWQRPGDPEPLPRPEVAARRFLDAYLAATDLPVAVVATHLLGLQRRRLPVAGALVGPAGLLLRAPMQARCWRFLSRLRGQGGGRTGGDPAGPQ